MIFKQSLLVLLLAAFISAQSAVEPIGERIYGGVVQKIGNRKFEAVVLPIGQLCGGTIIALGWVVTAAHCVFGYTPPMVKVRAGVTVYDVGGALRNLTNIIVPKQYVAKTKDYDIALLQLLAPFIATANIGTIALATTQPPAGSYIRVSGYGVLKPTVLQPNPLESVLLQTVNAKVCNTQYKGNVTARMFCAAASSGTKGPCLADDGGPATFNGTLLGVVSWGLTCVKGEPPSVYTRIPPFANWIKETMASPPPPPPPPTGTAAGTGTGG